MKTSEEVLFDNKIEWEKITPGIERKILGYDANIMMIRIGFEKGAVGAVHKHYHSQVSYVVKGEFELQIGSEKKTIKTGDGFYIPSNILHGVICREAGELIDVFSPAREGFLNASS